MRSLLRWLETDEGSVWVFRILVMVFAVLALYLALGVDPWDPLGS